MTVNEAKEILLTTPLKPIVCEALKVLLPDLMNYYDCRVRNGATL